MSTTIPLDLSGLSNVGFEEIRPLLVALSANPGDKPARRVRGLLLNRAVRLLRRGSRREINAEAKELSRFLDSADGKALRQRGAEVFGGLAAIGRLLSGAARQALPPPVDPVLLNYKGRGKQVLEALAARGEAVPRSELKSGLGLSESHLSHVLRELEEDVLILRYRSGQGVLVELTPTGREAVEHSVLPSWIQHLVDHLHGGRKLDPAQLADELHNLGAPSRTAAERLAEAVREIATDDRDVPAGDEPPAYVRKLDVWIRDRLEEDRGTPAHLYTELG